MRPRSFARPTGPEPHERIRVIEVVPDVGLSHVAEVALLALCMP